MSGGIAGIISLNGSRPVNRAELAVMLYPMKDHGSAGRVYYLGTGAGLAQSFVEQSWARSRQSRAIQVVSSSQIFNAAELRARLSDKGYWLSANDDAALLLALYLEYGDDFMLQLNGQFAIALWDEPRQRLLLVRDRAGIAPLFFAEHDGRLLFASEVKALLPALGQAPQLDPIALDQMFTFWSVQAPRTMFQGVSQLPPGELLVAEQGCYRRRAYWDWSFPQQPGDYDLAEPSLLAEQLRELLTDAVQLRQEAGPVGAYLSGGLDSSVLVALLKQVRGGPPNTFSIRFDDKSLDESAYQQRMVDHVGSCHSFVQCGPADVAVGFPDVIRRIESPLLRTAPVPLAMLSARVRREGFRAVLTGEGADEVLGGYDIFKEAKIRRFWARQPQSAWRPLLLKRLYPYLAHSQQGLAYLREFYGKGLEHSEHPFFSHLPRWLTTAMCKRFFSADLANQIDVDALTRLEQELPSAIWQWAPLNQAQYLEAKLLLPGYLLPMQGERMLQANAVQGRFPFLDHRIIEFAARLPPHVKVRVLDEKHVLKRALGARLPADILTRPKQPYRSPDIAAFFSGSVPGYVMELLSGSALRRYGYFDPQRVAYLIGKMQSGRAVGIKDSMALVGILSTQLWHYLFVEQYQVTSKAAWTQGQDFEVDMAGV